MALMDRYPPAGIRRRWMVHPRYILAAAGLLALLVFGSSFYEQARDREDILRMMRYQSASLAQAVAQSAEHIVYAGDEILQEVARRLESGARLLDRLDGGQMLSREHLQAMASEIGAANVDLYGANGSLDLSSRANDAKPAPAWLRPVLDGAVDVARSGFDGEGAGPGAHAVGVARSRGGAVVVYAETGQMLALRRKVGVGRLIQDIGTRAGVAYVVLQDEAGILAASGHVTRMSRIQNDPFLRRVLAEDLEDSRMTTFEDQEVFEAVRRFVLDGTPYGVLRIGLWAAPLREAEAWGRTRLLWMSGGLLVAGVVLFNFLFLKQNYDLVNRAYRQIRTYTGDILEHMADGVVVVDGEGRITVFNEAAERIFGYRADEAIGQSCWDIVTDQTPALEAALLHKLGASDMECRYRTRRGKALTLAVNTSVLLDEAGEAEAAIAVVRDLTEQKKQEEEARRRERLAAMGELAAGVAHEIRNPLNAVSMIAQRFEAEFVPAQDREEYLALARTVESELERVNGIVEQFLKFARPPGLKPAPVDLDALVREMTQVVSGKAEAGGVRIEPDLNLPGAVEIDREQMAQAILNLLLNAIDATSGGGSVSVHTRRLPPGEAKDGRRRVELVVADTGVGMEDEVLKQVFNPYFTTKPEGTGLGLSLVDRIVGEHGGRIEVDSQVGKGTTFRILLPEVRNAG